MLISTVIDPPALLSNEANAENQLIHLLRGLSLNGIVLLDNISILNAVIRDHAPARQDACLRELLIRVFRDFTFETRVAPKCSVEEVIAHLCDQRRPDLVVTDRNPFPGNLGAAANRTSSLANYHRSTAEQLRVEFAEGLKPIDELGIPKFGDLIRRTTRFSKWLKIYDPYLAKGEGESRFRKGLSFILSQWQQDCCHNSSECSVDLISIDHASKPGLSRLESVIAELQQEHRIVFHLLLVRDPGGKFHARHLETREFVVQVDPGFDFFDTNNQLRRILVKPARNDRGHLADLRRLQSSESVKKSFPVP